MIEIGPNLMELPITLGGILGGCVFIYLLVKHL